MGVIAHISGNHEIEHLQLRTVFRPSSTDVAIKFIIASMAKTYWKKDIAMANRKGFRIPVRSGRRKRSTGFSNWRKRDEQVTGAPMDSSSDSKGLREESSAISAIVGPNLARMVGVRPSKTEAAAMFALDDS